MPKLKYKPKSAVKTVVNNNEGKRTTRRTEEKPRKTKPSYVQALKSNTNTFEKVNSTNDKENNPTKTKRKIKVTQPSKQETKARNYPFKKQLKNQQEIKQLKEQIKLLKQTKSNHQEETKEIKTFKKRVPGLCVSRGPRRKHRTVQRHKLHRTNNDNFIKLRKTLEGTIRFQSDPAGQVIILSTERFCKDTSKRLNKNLNFVPTQKTINKDTIKTQFEDFLDK